MSVRAALLALTALLAVPGCTTRGVYEGLRSSEKFDCLQQPPGEIEQCRQRAEESYNDYSRNREETLGQ